MALLFVRILDIIQSFTHRAGSARLPSVVNDGTHDLLTNASPRIAGSRHLTRRCCAKMIGKC